MSAIKLQVASTRRRALAGLVDGAICLLIAATPYLVGLTDLDFLDPSPGIFFLDHLLVLFGQLPMVFLTPLLWGVIVWVFWQFGCLYFNKSTTLGGLALGLRTVDKHGDPLMLWGAASRAAGHGISALSLGLGWLWILVSAERRSWADLLSNTYTIRR